MPLCSRPQKGRPPASLTAIRCGTEGAQRPRASPVPTSDVGPSSIHLTSSATASQPGSIQLAVRFALHAQPCRAQGAGSQGRGCTPVPARPAWAATGADDSRLQRAWPEEGAPCPGPPAPHVRASRCRLILLQLYTCMKSTRTGQGPGPRTEGVARPSRVLRGLPQVATAFRGRAGLRSWLSTFLGPPVPRRTCGLFSPGRRPRTPLELCYRTAR